VLSICYQMRNKNFSECLKTQCLSQIFRQQDKFCLFPLNSADGLGGQVVEDAVDAVYLVGDTVGDVLQQLEGDVLNGCSHSIHGVDGADDCGPTLVALAVLDADRLHVGDSDKVLPYLAGKAVLIELLTEDGVSLTQGVETVAGDGTKAADTQTGAGEGLTVDHAVGQTQSVADNADFVLVQQLDRLDQFKLHILRQAANIVVSLDTVRLQNVGVNGALSEEADAVELGSLFVKDLYKLSADDLALLLRLADTGQQVEETVGSINIDKVCVKLLTENFDNLLALALAHETMVDMDAGELLADGLDKEGSNNGGVNAAGEGEQNLTVANLSADLFYLFINKSISQFKRSDTLHGFRTYVTGHINHPSVIYRITEKLYIYLFDTASFFSAEDKKPT